MNPIKIQFAIFLENLHMKCMYYPEDRYGCKKLTHICKFCNCDGDISKCDLTEEELGEEKRQRGEGE